MRSFLLLALVSACAAADGGLDTADGPGAKADGTDHADRDCQIVLRTLGQPSGLPSHSAEGVNWVVYEGSVDVAQGAEGTAMALFSNGHNGWWQAEATPTTGVVAGYDRYTFTLDRYTVPMGDNTAWRNMRIQVIPFLATAGGRLFDHNRYRDDLANYTITKDETRYGDDLAVCH